MDHTPNVKPILWNFYKTTKKEKKNVWPWILATTPRHNLWSIGEMQIKTTSHRKYNWIKSESLTICISYENVQEPELCWWKWGKRKGQEGRKEGRRGRKWCNNPGKVWQLPKIHLLNDPGFILRYLASWKLLVYIFGLIFCGGVVISFFPPCRRVSVSLFQLRISLRSSF